MLAEGVPGSRLTAEFMSPRGPAPVDVGREWLEHLRGQERRRPITVYQYAARLDQFFTWIGATPLDGVRLDQIEGWLSRPSKGSRGERAASTVAKECAIIRGFYKYALGRGYVAVDPTAMLGTPTVRRRNPKPVPDNVWQTQWGCAGLGVDARFVLGMGYLVGLRRSEIVNLGARHLDVRNCRIEGVERKGGGDDVIDYGELSEIVHEGRPELCPDPRVFTDALRTLVRERAHATTLLDWGDGVASPRARVMHGLGADRMDPQLIYRRLHRWQEAAGLDARAYHPHQLRHSFVTNLLRPPINMPIHLVSVLANHSSISVTWAYAKIGGQELRDWRRHQDRPLRADHPRFP